MEMVTEQAPSVFVETDLEALEQLPAEVLPAADPGWCTLVSCAKVSVFTPFGV